MLLELLSSFLSIIYKGFFSIGPFFLLLGILVFIHELGHFLAARFCGVKVEVFSLGFGPKIFKYKKQDTVYCLSLIPLGGYVKMFGDNPLMDVPKEKQYQGFLYQKVPKKLFIAAAGPLMNLLFTLVAFLTIGVLGWPTPPAELGDIKKNTKAHQAGLRSGNKILSVNGEKVSYWFEVEKFMQNNSNSTILFQTSSTEGIKNHTIPVEFKNNEDILGREKTQVFIEGLSLFSKGTQIGVPAQSLAYKKGLRTFDIIESINGKPVRYFRDLKKAWQAKKITLILSRQKEKKTFLLTKKISFHDLGLENLELYISKVGPNTPAEKAGLQKGDRLLSIDGILLQSWPQVLQIIQSNSKETFELKYRRKGMAQKIMLSPKIMFAEGNLKEKKMIGIGVASFQVLPPTILKKEGLAGAFVYSGKQTVNWLKIISVGVWRIVRGEISVRNLGGPIAIGRAAHSKFQEGFISFLFIMAVLSLNLFFINLLPIPILDGGHILFFSLEGLLGKSLDIKKIVIAQNLGLLVLLFFFVFTFLNDIYNWATAW